VILDLGLPDVDGLSVCRKLRAARPDLAILILTARDQELDVVSGLDAGADDYLVKPFRLSELLARVRAHLRRAATSTDAEPAAPLRAGEIEVDRAARRAWRGGDELELRPKEFDLLALLVAEGGRAVTRERIMREVWDTDWTGSTKTLDTHVLALRNKIGPDAITTLRGVGYRFEAS
jgi:DNA-binding response OmpR family regulator